MDLGETEGDNKKQTRIDRVNIGASEHVLLFLPRYEN